MGTRGLWGFTHDGQTKVTYVHWDSYPDGLGNDLVQALRTRTLDELRARVRELTLVQEDDSPTQEQLNELTQYVNTGVGGIRLGNITWYQALRGTQGILAATLDSGYMIDSFDFGYDSLFCEWGYVIDLDANQFVVYEGFTKTEMGEGLWAGGEAKELSGGYGPIRPVKAFDLTDAGVSVEEWEAWVAKVNEED